MRTDVRIRIWLIVALVLFVILAPTLARWYTDWLWFGEVGYRRVFWIPLLSRIGVTLVVGGVAWVLAWLNLRPLLRGPGSDAVIDLTLERGGRGVYRRGAGRLRFSTVLWAVLAGVAYVFGVLASEQWPMFQQFAHAQPFGATDPIFGRDIAFFVFRLPVYHFAESWLFVWMVTLFVVVATVYYLRHVSRMLRGIWALPSGPRAHLSLLAGGIVLVRSWGFWLDAYELEYSPRGAIFGASFTDLHAVLPTLRTLTILFVVGAGLLFANVRLRTLRLAVVTSLLVAGAWALGLGVLPHLVQQIRVTPNELTVETPYIRNGVASTLRAFGLDRLQEREFAADAVTPEIAVRNRATIENVRLWDYRPLLAAYQQLQGLRPYYVFGIVDIDRYQIGGTQRQVMLAARELDPSRLSSQAQTWVNEHLVYTHGYGLVMSPVNRVSEEGMPEFFLKNIPPTGLPELAVQRPQIYYGEHTTGYVVTNTGVQELDYPRGDENVYTSYQGRGGILLTEWRRLAFGYRFGDPRLLLSTDVSSQSKLLFARDLSERVRRIAPFLAYDADPYLVLVGGRLKWILDAYTQTNRYPYATPFSGINYIRNSVKVVMDAYDGTVDFYQVDATDPLANSFAAIFPELLKPAGALSPNLAAHLRYPVGLFALQARVYASFHMRDPRVFYNREDVWTIPTELYGSETIRVEPYYVTMRLSGEQPEFILILPFAPANRDNMIAWMAARSDAPHYGELVVYRFPKDRLVFGPMQVESRINQDPVISQQLTLWNQQGSRVIRGNLLVIPMENALLYVEPLFLQAEQSQLPELRRVIVASGSHVVMEETLDAALARLFGAPVVPPAGAVLQGPVKDLVRQANEAYRQALQLLRQGDLAGYSRQIERVGQLLQQLEERLK